MFASQLVKTNKALALAENYEEMALAILNDAPPSIEAVAIALFNRPFTLMGTPVSLKTHALVTRQESIQTELIDQFSAIEDARVTYFLHEFIEGRMMLLWNINRPANPVMLQSLVAQLKQTENVNLITAFGLNMRSSLRGIIVFAGDEDLREKGPQHDGLRAIADQLAAVIENRILLNQTSEALDLIQTQYETSNQVLRSNSLTDILQAIINFSGNAFQSAHLVSTGINGITRIIAEVTNNEGQLVSHPVSLSDYPGSQSLSVLEALEVRNVHEDTFITEDEKQQLLEQNIASFVILPILSNAALDGLVMLTSDEPIRIPPDRIRAMRSLADQVGIVLENQKLLQNTEASLQEIQVLYEANRAMFNTQNDRDVLRVLKNNLAPDTSVICQINIKYQPNHRNQIKAIIFGYELTNQTEKQLQETLTNDQKTMGEIYKYLREIQDNVLFAPTGDIIPDNPINFIANRYNIRSYATIVIKDRGQIASLIYLLFDEPKPFIDTTQRLYEAIADQAIISIEKQKLLRESQLTANKLSDQVQVLQNISDLAVQINLIKEEKVLLDTGTKVLVDALNIDHCGIVLFNEDLKTGKVVSEYPTKNFIGITIDIQDNPILSPGFDLSQAWVIEDVKNDAGITDVLRKTLMDANIYALVIIPLVGNNNELIGSIGLDILNKTRYFNDTEIQTAQTIAAQMAIGLQNIRLLSAAQQRAIQLQHISDFSQASQATLDLDQLIKQALSNIPNILDITHMTISLYDNIHEELVLMGGWQQDHSNRTQLDIGITVPTKNTTAGYVLESGDYLYIPNIQKQSSLVYPLSRTIASLLSVPLRNRGITMGIVAIGSHRANAYTNTDIAVFQQLVNQMSVAIDNAQAYTQSQRIAQNKTLANDIAIKLQRQDTLENMINMTMKEVGRAISAKKGRIRLNNNIQQTDER